MGVAEGTSDQGGATTHSLFQGGSKNTEFEKALSEVINRTHIQKVGSCLRICGAL